MPLDVKKLGVSFGVGIVDNVIVEAEERGMLKGNWAYLKDGLRIVEAVGGYLMDTFGVMPDIAEPLTISSIPLALHSIRERVKAVFKKSAVPVRGTLAPQVSPQQASQPTSQPRAVAPLIVSY